MLSACANNKSGNDPTAPDTTVPMITNHSFTVTENIAVDTVIGTVNASDNIGVISYLITHGNTSYAFSIITNGQLKTTMRLDYDTTSNYSLTVEVRDAAGNNSNATVTINVTDVDATPTVTTLNASEIRDNSVILNGNLNYLGSNSDGNEQINEIGFLYSTNASQHSDLQLGKNGVQRNSDNNPANTGNYSQVIAGLSPGTAYYFRAFAVNDGGTGYGNITNFSTTYHRNFTLSGATNGEQTRIIHAHSTHTYSVPLRHDLMYSLTVEADSNISSNVMVYEGLSTEPFYIKAAPFTSGGVTFPGFSNGHRYMVLPLDSNSHRIVISNNSGQNENYSLNLAEYLGINPDTRRLLVTPQKMGFYDSTSDPRHFWVHIPANKKIQIARDGYTNRGTRAAFLRFPNASDETFSPVLTLTRTFNNPASNEHQYSVLSMRNSFGGTLQQTSHRLVFSFVD